MHFIRHTYMLACLGVTLSENENLKNGMIVTWHGYFIIIIGFFYDLNSSFHYFVHQLGLLILRPDRTRQVKWYDKKLREMKKINPIKSIVIRTESSSGATVFVLPVWTPAEDPWLLYYSFSHHFWTQRILILLSPLCM